MPCRTTSFLATLLGDEIGCAETCEDNDARTERSVLVVALAVVGQTGGHETTVAIAVDAFFLGSGSTLEDTTTIRIGESHRGESEDNCNGHYQLFHLILSILFYYSFQKACKNTHYFSILK